MAKYLKLTSWMDTSVPDACRESVFDTDAEILMFSAESVHLWLQRDHCIEVICNVVVKGLKINTILERRVQQSGTSAV